MADIFREVDEELRREQAHKLWRKYGPYILAAAIFLVLATVAVVAWREWREAERRTHAAELAAATALAEQGRTEDALRSLAALAAEAGEGYALLARLHEAALRSEQQDSAGAAAIYDDIAADTNVPTVYRDLAIVLLALNTLDTADPPTMIDRLAPLTASENPLHYTALELTGLLERRAGNDERAREIFDRLAEDATAPPGVRERAQEMQRLLPRGPTEMGAN